MTNEQFWRIIKETRVDMSISTKMDNNEKIQRMALAERLNSLTGSEIISFREKYYEMWDSLLTRDIWAVHFIISGGSSVDGFDLFRHWIVSMGEENYAAILKDASLVATWTSQPLGDAFFGDGWSDEIRNAYLKKTGKIIPGLKLESRKNKWLKWNPQNEIREKYPHIYNRFWLSKDKE